MTEQIVPLESKVQHSVRAPLQHQEAEQCEPVGTTTPVSLSRGSVLNLDNSEESCQPGQPNNVQSLQQDDLRNLCWGYVWFLLHRRYVGHVQKIYPPLSSFCSPGQYWFSFSACHSHLAFCTRPFHRNRWLTRVPTRWCHTVFWDQVLKHGVCYIYSWHSSPLNKHHSRSDHVGCSSQSLPSRFPNRTIKSVEIILLTTPPRNSIKVRHPHVWCTCMSSSTQLLNAVWESQFHCKSVSTPTPQKAFQHRWGCRKYWQTAASWVGMSERTTICVSSNTKSFGSVHKLRIDKTYTRNRQDSLEGIHSLSLIVDMGWSQGSKSIYRWRPAVTLTATTCCLLVPPT